jgi:hypothetical protein
MVKLRNFLDLKIGTIKEYSMVIKKIDLSYWKGKGWMEFTEIGLKQGAEKAYMLYGDIKENETLVFNKPVLLRDTLKENIIDRKLLGICTHLGTYGMGGPGFFGLLLDNTEYLTYAVWYAGSYVIIDDRVVECHPDLYKETKPWFSKFGGEEDWDELTDYISESVILDYHFTKDTFLLKLEKGNRTINVSFVRNDVSLPKRNDESRIAFEQGEISDYILLQNENAVLIT